MKKKTAVLLLNLGTPDSPSVGDVRRYLKEFLNDPRVFDTSWLVRKIVVNCFIVPFRAPKSAKLYRQLWTKEGSPLLVYGNELKEKIQEKLSPENIDVYFAMRYQNPSIPNVLRQMETEGYSKIVIFPLFPQYASASTGSAVEKVMDEIKKWWVIPEVSVIQQFFDNADFLDAWKIRGEQYQPENYDHILFSFHGLPIRQLTKAHQNEKSCTEEKCTEALTRNNYNCYQATCYETARQIAKRLNIPEEKFTVSFQSRLGKTPWVKPFTDKIIKKLAKKDVKKLLVFSPAFVADCLETTIEIGNEYTALFKEHGGEQLQLVESLNVEPQWVDAVCNMALEAISTLPQKQHSESQANIQV